MMKDLIYFLLLLLFTIFIHELSHLITARLVGVKVNSFSLGFGKWYLHAKWKGIDWRISPILLGGYCELEGETDPNNPYGFFAQPYWKKFVISIAGVTANLVAAICLSFYLFHSFQGIYYAHLFLVAIFNHNQNLIEILFLKFPSFYLSCLLIFNYLSFLLNIIPYPALDGGNIVFIWIEKIFSDKLKFARFWKIFTTFGFFSAAFLQLLILYFYFKS